MNESKREQMRALLKGMAQETPERLDARWDDVLAEVLQTRFEADEDLASDSFQERAKQRLRDAAASPQPGSEATNGRMPQRLLFKLRRPTLRFGLVGALVAAGALVILLIVLLVGRIQNPSPLVGTPPKPQVQPLTPKTAPSPNEGAIVEKGPAPKQPTPHAPTPRSKGRLAAKIKIGKAGQVMGAPTITMAGERKAIALKPGIPLFANATVETGDADKLEVVLNDGTTMRLGFNTRIRIPAVAKKALRPDEIALDTGEVWAVVQHLPSAEAFEVITPVATARVLGTEFGLKVRRRSRTDIAHHEDPAEGESKTGSASRIAVEAVLIVKEGCVAFYNSHGSVQAPRMTESTAIANAKPTEPKRLASFKPFQLTNSFAIVAAMEVVGPDVAAYDLALEMGKAKLKVSNTTAREVRVERADRGGPAWKAGLREGDLILTIDGEPVYERPQVLVAIMEHPNSVLSVVVDRQGAQMTFRLTPTRTEPKSPGWSVLVTRKLWETARLLAWGRTVEAEQTLREELRLHPSAALHDALGDVLQLHQDEAGEQIRQYQRAVALRPDVGLFHYHLGQALKSIGNLDRAVEELEAAVRLAPAWTFAVTKLAEAYMLSDRNDDALRVADHTVKNFPRSATTWIRLADVMIRLARPNDALDALTKAVEIEPDGYVIYERLGMLYMYTGQFENAVVAIRRVIELNPTYATAHDNLGNALGALSKLEEAEQEYRKAIELDPKSASTYSNLGNLLDRMRRFPEAEESYKKALELDPNSSAAHYNFGDLLARVGRLDEAEEEIRKAIELDPKMDQAHGQLGDVLVRTGKLDEAEKAFRKAIELEPKRSMYYSKLGDLLARSGRLIEAEAAFRKAIELDPKLSSAHSGLGDLFARTGRLDEAEVSFRKLIELRPKLTSAYGRLGNVLAAKGRFGEAEQAYREILKLRPGDPSALNSIAWNLAKQGIRLDEALGYADEAAKAAPNNPGIHVTLGWVQFKRKAYTEAEAALLRAIKIYGSNPSAAEVWAHLGEVYEAMDQRQKAIDAYKESLKIDPARKDAREALKRLGG